MKIKMKIIYCCLLTLIAFGCVTITYVNPYSLEDIYSKFEIPSNDLDIRGRYFMKSYPWRDYQLLDLSDSTFHWEASFGCMVPTDTTHIIGKYYRIEDTLKFTVEESFDVNGYYNKKENFEIDSQDVDEEVFRQITMWETKLLKIRTYNKKICLLDYRSVGLIHSFLGDSPNTTIDEMIIDMLPENRRTISTFYSKLDDE